MLSKFLSILHSIHISFLIFFEISISFSNIFILIYVCGQFDMYLSQSALLQFSQNFSELRLSYLVVIVLLFPGRLRAFINSLLWIFYFLYFQLLGNANSSTGSGTQPIRSLQSCCCFFFTWILIFLRLLVNQFCPSYHSYYFQLFLQYLILLTVHSNLQNLD